MHLMHFSCTIIAVGLSIQSFEFVLKKYFFVYIFYFFIEAASSPRCDCLSAHARQQLLHYASELAFYICKVLYFPFLVHTHTHTHTHAQTHAQLCWPNATECTATLANLLIRTRKGVAIFTGCLHNFEIYFTTSHALTRILRTFRQAGSPRVTSDSGYSTASQRNPRRNLGNACTYSYTSEKLTSNRTSSLNAASLDQASHGSRHSLPRSCGQNTSSLRSFNLGHKHH